MGRGRARVAAVVGCVAVVGFAGHLPGASAGPAPTPTAVPGEPTVGPLISGTVSQLHGTHVWTDYAYDDRGADAGAEPTYPEAAAPGNAADLVQLQIRPERDVLRIRAVLETLTDPSVPSIGVGLDLDADPGTGAPGVPGSGWQVAGSPLGLERFVVADGTGATVLGWDGASWAPVGSALAAVDPDANVVDAEVAWSMLGGDRDRWRAVGVAGLALPGATWVDGSGPIYDLAYVRDTSRSNFQSNEQAAVLSGAADASGAVAVVELDGLDERVDLAEPEPGIKNTFLYRSALDLGEGIRTSTQTTNNDKYAGPYQPYVVWFPEDLPEHPPLVVFLHGAMGDHTGGSYGEDGAFVDVGIDALDIGVIAPTAVVVTPLARAETPLGMDGPAEQDVLDVIADVSARFAVDDDRVVLTGYSLGGVGTFRLAQLYPDRWAGAVEIVGAPDLGALTLAEEAQGHQSLPNQLENLRNLPFRLAHSRLDELELIVGAVQPDLAALELHRLGYDYRYWQFLRRDHLNFPVDTIQCELDAAIARGRVHDPARVTYSQEPAIVSDDPATGLDLHHDRAYWLSEMVVRDTTATPGEEGTVDVTSLARADRSPALAPVAGVGENITAGRDVCGDNPDVRTNDVWTAMGQAWSPGAEQPVSNGLVATLTNVASVRLDLRRMGLDVEQPLVVDVVSDGPSVLRLACPAGGVLDLPVASGAATITITPGPGRCG